VAQFHPQQLGRLQEALKVIGWPKDEQFLFFLVPVSAHAPKRAGAVIKGVIHHADFRFRIGYDLSLEIGIIGKNHRTLLSKNLFERIVFPLCRRLYRNRPNQRLKLHGKQARADSRRLGLYSLALS
jgi:hypothetical protein